MKLPLLFDKVVTSYVTSHVTHQQKLSNEINSMRKGKLDVAATRGQVNFQAKVVRYDSATLSDN